ncbi:MAG TPA: hypothetical protein VID05_09345 [Acidimicrobiales bacterium]|jgi:hypothetical protein
MTQDQPNDEPRTDAIKADLVALEKEVEVVSRRLLYRVLAVLGFVAVILLLSWLVGRSSRED